MPYNFYAKCIYMKFFFLMRHRKNVCLLRSFIRCHLLVTEAIYLQGTNYFYGTDCVIEKRLSVPELIANSAVQSSTFAYSHKQHYVGQQGSITNCGEI